MANSSHQKKTASRKSRPSESNGAAEATDVAPRPRTAKRRSTAQAMAASQRDISVSEFFAKNRHLLGFDNPRKALLTTVKEAVDNSLDACEEAGILPGDLGPHRADRRRPLQGRHPGQRPGHPQEADPADLRQAALRIEVPPPAPEPRPARHRHQRRRHVRRADHRQAGQRSSPRSRPASRPTTTKSRSTPRSNEPRILNGKRRRRRHPARRQGRSLHRKARHRVGRPAPRHARDHRTRGQVRPRSRQRRRVSRADGHRQPAHHAALPRPRRLRLRHTSARAEVLPPEPKEIKPHPYGVELGRLAAMLEERNR